jgi:hypothetical protein
MKFRVAGEWQPRLAMIADPAAARIRERRGVDGEPIVGL